MSFMQAGFNAKIVPQDLSRKEIDEKKWRYKLNKEGGHVNKHLKEKRIFYDISRTIVPTIAKERRLTGSYYLQNSSGHYTSHLEIKKIKTLLEEDKFTPEERKKLMQYSDDLARSVDLNLGIGRNSTLKQASPHILKPLVDKIYSRLDHLKEGDSLYLNWGHAAHAMTIRILKEQGNVKLTLYDSSGGLYRCQMLNSFKILTLLVHKKYRGSISTALEINIKDKELFSKQGKDYFYRLLEYNTSFKHHEFRSRLEGIKKITKSLPHCFRFLAYLVGLFVKWKGSVDCFLSIPHSSARLLPTLQFSQVGPNCHSARQDAIMVNVLGKELYKKVKSSITANVKVELLADALANDLLTPNQAKNLRKMPVSYLTPSEIRQAARIAARLESQEFNYKEWEAIVKLLNHQVAMNKLVRVDKTSLGKTVSFKPSHHVLSPEALKTAIVVNRYGFANIKTRKIGVFSEGEWLELNKTAFFKELKKHPELLITEEIALLMNFFSLHDEVMPIYIKEQIEELKGIQGDQLKNEQYEKITKLRQKMITALAANSHKLTVKKRNKIIRNIKKLYNLDRSVNFHLVKNQSERAVKIYLNGKKQVQDIESEFMSILKGDEN